MKRVIISSLYIYIIKLYYVLLSILSTNILPANLKKNYIYKHNFKFFTKVYTVSFLKRVKMLKTYYIWKKNIEFQNKGLVYSDILEKNIGLFLKIKKKSIYILIESLKEDV